MEPEPEPELLGAAQRLSGLWRAKGKTMRGGSTEEFLQLDVSASGVVTVLLLGLLLRQARLCTAFSAAIRS